jgi:subtilisin family serine protease
MPPELEPEAAGPSRHIYLIADESPDQPGLDGGMSPERRRAQIRLLQEWRLNRRGAFLERIQPWVVDGRLEILSRDFGLGRGLFGVMYPEDADQLRKATGFTITYIHEHKFIIPPPPAPGPAAPPGREAPAPARPTRPHAPSPRAEPPPAGAGWHLEAIGLSAARREGFTGTGRGVTLAILDTGIDADHPALRGKVIAQRRFDREGRGHRRVRPRDSDPSGHGTSVAGLICGEHVGVAPDARLLCAEVLAGGWSYTVQIAAGLHWAVSHEDVRIVVFCLGFPGQLPAMQSIITTTLNLNILPIIAAGNDGPGAASSPGNCFGAFSVGAALRDGRVAPFSSSQRLARSVGPKRRSYYQVPELVGPGEEVWSCSPGQGYTCLTGTTPPTSIVAGVAALLLEQRPDLSAFELAQALRDSCKDLGDRAARQGRGLIQVRGARWI